MERPEAERGRADQLTVFELRVTHIGSVMFGRKANS